MMPLHYERIWPSFPAQAAPSVIKLVNEHSRFSSRAASLGGNARRQFLFSIRANFHVHQL